jgi:hypothetical protein
MGQTPGEIMQNLAERVCWEVARRDDSRVARRLYRTPLVNGVDRLDAGLSGEHKRPARQQAHCILEFITIWVILCLSRKEAQTRWRYRDLSTSTPDV